MKNSTNIIAASLLCLGLISARAQFGGHGSAAISDAMSKLFGDNQTFTATMEVETSDPTAGGNITMPGKLSFDHGKSRFEMNMGEIKGSALPPQAVEQMKAMGMDQMVSISRPDSKSILMVYPGIQSYAENALPEKATATADDFKVDTTELGKEAADGHDCVKNKVVVTEKDGTKHESTVWNATDLKKFPVKIETTEQGHHAVMHFKDVTFTTPAASAFEAPASYKKYSGMQEMMQDVMMKKMAGFTPPK